MQPVNHKKQQVRKALSKTLAMNVQAADDLVQEYCVYRGFTQTFRCLEQERANDKTKSFEAHQIVQTLFDYLNNGLIENFISLWDFLNKRFFLHLDQEHLLLFSHLKSDLIKYYLVSCIKLRNKSKIGEFFANYSHEILSTESGKSDLRAWYVLPYLEDPDRDPDFSVYFSSRW